jgi:hypothetical protein
VTSIGAHLPLLQRDTGAECGGRGAHQERAPPAHLSGAQFTCFTRTNVLNVVVEGRVKKELPQLTFLVLSLLALLVQKYKY